MEFQIRKIYTSSRTDFVDIEPLSDIHVGARFHDKVKFKEVVERIKNQPNRYTFIMGDVFDCTDPDNKFFDMRTRDPELPELSDQMNYIVKMLLPIRNKILGVHTGNHDERQRLRHYDDLIGRLVAELNRDYPDNSGIPRLQAPIRYLGYMAITRLQFILKSETSKEHIMSSFDVFTAHGGYSGKRVGGNLNSNQDLLASFSADIYLTGHTHQVVIHKVEKIGMDQFGHLAKVVKISAVCGSFAQPYNEGFITYPEYKLLPASRVGTVTVSIQPFERKLQAHE